MNMNKNKINQDKKKRAIFDLEGATCMSCVYAIEYLGRHIKGIKDLYVDVTTHKVYVEYEGSTSVLTGISDIVSRIGYKATLQMSEVPS